MKKWIFALAAIVALVVLSIVFWYAFQPSAPKTAAGKVGPASYYPDPSYTPGAVLSVSVQELCQPYYSAHVRRVTRKQKLRIFAHYGVHYPAKRGTYEFDHFFPLELGGSNDDANLWPEPAFPVPGFHQKDIVENYLHRQVCVTHTMTLAEAQNEMRRDWYAVYLRYVRTK